MTMMTAILTHKPKTDLSPALYDAMCHAIDAAYEVDEVKDIRDKAMAFEVYARMAQNVDAESRACRIRLRAERRAGQLLKAMEKAKGGQPYQSNCTDNTGASVERIPTLANRGVTPRQASDWQRLADVPEEQFEAALDNPDRKPSTAGILANATPPKPEIIPVSPAALWLWGRLNDFERDGLLDREPADVLLTMTPQMLDTTHRLAPRVAAWLGRIGRLLP